jgi:acetate kinase
MAVLGRVDAIVFTAGIGENDAFLREYVCEGMEELGILFDEQENSTRKPGARAISTPDSRVKVLVIPTNEELEIAESALRTLGK